MIDGQPVLRFERHLPHLPAKVWKAITEPGELVHWFPARVETALRAGAPMRFTFDDWDIDPTEGEILELDPPKVFAYRWQQDVLRWELTPDGTGCRLVFTHSLSATGPFGGVVATARHAAGWDACLDQLLAQLDGRSRDSSMDDWFERHEQYVDAFGLAEGEIRDEPDGYLIRFERDLVQPCEEVWTAMTSRDAVTVGDRTPEPVTNERLPAGQVTAVERPRLVEYEWEDGDRSAGAVRWELSDQGVGCMLVVTQTVPSELADRRAADLAAWHMQLELFVATVNGRVRTSDPDRINELEKLYADRLG
jgi:uncharacterized protein YndB with AHSA1/START domain